MTETMVLMLRRNLPTGEVTKSTTPDTVWFQQGHLPRGYLAVLDRQIAAAEKKNDSPLKKGQH